MIGLILLGLAVVVAALLVCPFLLSSMISRRDGQDELSEQEYVDAAGADW
jgi:hypothetical protein